MASIKPNKTRRHKWVPGETSKPVSLLMIKAEIYRMQKDLIILGMPNGEKMSVDNDWCREKDGYGAGHE